MERFVKIVFRLEVDEDGYPPVSAESLNARVEKDGTFVLDNTPFFATGVALGDRVAGVPIPETVDRFEFRRVVEASNSRSISIIFLSTSIKDDVSRELQQRGCYCEYGEFGNGGGCQMLAVAIPADRDLEAIVCFLEQQENEGVLSFAELAL